MRLRRGHPLRAPGAALLAILVIGVSATGLAAADQQDRGPCMSTPQRPHQTPDWRDRVADLVARTLSGADAAWRRVGERLGFCGAGHIAAYRGYANDDHIWVQGRLLGGPPYGGPQDDDTWWDNIKATWRRWESDEIPHARIALRYADQVIEVRTDDEGYYSAILRRDPDRDADKDAGHPGETIVTATHRTGGKTLTAAHRVLVPRRNATHMLISDVDDTVIHTAITDPKTAAELSLLNNAKTRKPLPGVAALYRELQRPAGAEVRNPVFYVSNSAWNMYDLLRDFLDLNELPPGPLLLRDLDLVDMITGAENHHKRDRIEEILQRVPLPAVLIGDSGQHDASLYADIAARYPRRILAIYIRDVDPDAQTERDLAVARVIEHRHLDGIPFRLVRDSAAIAADLARIGVLPHAVPGGLGDAVDDDGRRETVAEKAGGEIPTPGG